MHYRWWLSRPTHGGTIKPHERTSFEKGYPISELVRTAPNIAFEVDDLDKEIQGKELLSEVSSLSESVRMAMIKTKINDMVMCGLQDNDPIRIP